MSQEYIEIRGARENNLKNVSLSIPKRKITIFTGVSGSGKSSIVFDTSANEAQRLLNEILKQWHPDVNKDERATTVTRWLIKAKAKVDKFYRLLKEGGES